MYATMLVQLLNGRNIPFIIQKSCMKKSLHRYISLTFNFVHICLCIALYNISIKKSY